MFVSAKQVDGPIVFVGLTPNNDPTNAGTPPVNAKGSAFEGEGHDRTDIDLQGQQLPLIKALVAANPKTVSTHRKPTSAACDTRNASNTTDRWWLCLQVVALIHGGAVDITWCKENGVAAILDAHYPGQVCILTTLVTLDWF